MSAGGAAPTRDTSDRDVAPPARANSDAPSRASLLHGRRKGKKLGIHHRRLLHDLAPALTVDVSQPIDDPSALFGQRPGPLWLEIGFGGGEHLAATASRHPEVNLVGCESFRNGIAKALELIEQQGLENIRLHDGDARCVIDALPAQSVARVYLLFPDPWPKRRQHKRRFVSDESLSRLARSMCAGAELRIATDIDDYTAWILARVLASPDFMWQAATAQDWQRPWAEWPGTRYEAKARAEDRRSVYLTFVRHRSDASCIHMHGR
jgi:tRNA (guanine-N7-)-methyltransferase